MNMEEELKKHFEEDRINFKKIEDKFLEQTNNHLEMLSKVNTILVHVKTSNEFMENMSGLNDLVKGTSLLKKPALWFLAFIVGIVTLFGGFKTLLSWFVISK